ncbi:MAG: alpha-L-rhamnosidase C-terminal domain-containing protein [Trebonia sp.]|jgi:alpha-L-rhamnosidase
MFFQHALSRHRRRLIASTLAIAGLLIGLLAGIGAAPGASAAASTTPWPSSPNWQAYDETPTSAQVCPTAVHSTSGTVSGASTLLCGGSADATLTYVSGGTAPTIVYDYGREVGGVPYFYVSSESGSPTLQAGYSESSLYISPTGGDASPWAEGDPKRYDDYTVTGAGTITNTYVQGGERYEEITLTTPGTVTLSGIGVNYIADQTQASALPGYFDSSNSQLNQIWYDSEYTDQLDSVPAGSLPGSWQVTGGVLQAGGPLASNPVGLLNGGSSWGNYTMSFQTQIVDNQSGWFVRGQDAGDGYAFILNDSTDTSGTPNQLQEFDVSGGNYNSLGSVALSAPLLSGTWHTVTTTVSGSTLTVSLDGTQLTQLTNSSYATGAVGFREYNGEEADFKDLTVTSSTGSTLFSNPLSSSSVLSDFTVPGTNEYASMIDGAKRDRAIWSGDMNVEIPSIAYSTDNTAYAKGALQLLGSYQLTSGFVTGDLPPQDDLSPSEPSGTTGSYSASYSIYWLLGLADYYLYSGDTSFVTQELPVVKNQLAWDASQVNSAGLLVTNSSDDADWDFYDPGKTGEVTEYNLLYYKALLDGAVLATAAGDTSDAASYSSEAAALKTAINNNLYDSSTGLYYLSNTDTGTVAQDANSLAVLYGVAPAADDAKLLAALKTDLWTTPYGPEPFSGSTYSSVISPYATGYEVDASLSANDTADAESLLETEWGDMINSGNPDDTGTMWENISASNGQVGFGASSSLAHGWATTPVAALSGYFLGVQPATAGYATWTVEPHPGDLSWAEGNVPTPHGSIAVDWAGQSGTGQFSMQVTAPSGTTGTIAVPTYGATDPIITVGGQTVWSNGTFTATTGITGASANGNYVDLTGVQPGTYLVASNPGNYGVPTGFTKCAAENGTCSVTGTEEVAFGANGIYTYATESASVTCGDTVFSDPDYGVAKSCYTGPVTTGPSGTTYCGPENSLCSFYGTETVYFGAGSDWTSKTITGGTPCTDAVFGDPDYGVVKSCYVA